MINPVTIRNLLEAGVHFGHETRKWDPRMAPYIYTKRNEIHILDLQKTVKLILKACDRVKKVAERGGNILFVSTKRQAQEIIREAAERAGVQYVNHRWLGGTLTNFNTIRQRISHLKKLERMLEVGDMDLLGKKERAKRMRELRNLERNLNGIRDMDKVPDLVFIIDPSREHLAVDECKKLGIPIIAITDTNCNPTPIEYVIPGNDDAIRSIKLIVNYITDAIIEGKEISRATQEKEEVSVN